MGSSLIVTEDIPGMYKAWPKIQKKNDLSIDFHFGNRLGCFNQPWMVKILDEI